MAKVQSMNLSSSKDASKRGDFFLPDKLSKQNENMCSQINSQKVWCCKSLKKGIDRNTLLMFRQDMINNSCNNLD